MTAATESREVDDAPRQRGAGSTTLRLPRARRQLRRALRALSAIFGLRYDRVPLERLLPVVQILGMLALAHACAEIVMWGFSVSTGRGLLHLLVVAPLTFVGGVALLRVGLTFVLALVRIADNMEDVAELPRWLREWSTKKPWWRNPSDRDRNERFDR